MRFADDEQSEKHENSITEFLTLKDRKNMRDSDNLPRSGEGSPLKKQGLLINYDDIPRLRIEFES